MPSEPDGAADDGVLTSAPDATAALRIEVERATQAGFLHGRQDLWVRGRVSAAEPVEQIALRIGRQELSRIVPGRTGTAVAGPDGTIVTQHAFTFCLSRLVAEARAPCRFAVVATTPSGSVAETFTVAPEHDGEGAASVVVAGPTVQADAPGAARAPILLYVERAGIDADGVLHVMGWALSGARIVTIQVFGADRLIGGAQLGRSRGDVAAAYPDWPNAGSSGFLLTARPPDALRNLSHLRIEAVSLNGSTHEVIRPVVSLEAPEAQPLVAAAPPAPAPALAPGPPPPPVPAEAAAAHPIRTFLDEALLAEDGRLLVSGWAVCTVGIVRVEIALDGEAVGEADLALPRPDVGDAFPTIPMARFAGFRFDASIGEAAEGSHEVTVTAVNGLGETRRERIPVTATSPAAARAAAAGGGGGFRLEVDMPQLTGGAVAHPVAGMLTIQGWSLAAARIVAVEVFVDGERKGAAHYGLARADVAEAHPARDDALRSGFVFLCPLRGLANGPHTVRLLARAADGETATEEFGINVQEDASASAYAEILRRLPPVQRGLYAARLAAVATPVAFRLLLRLDAAATPAALTATLASLAAQVCTAWHLDALPVRGRREAAALRALLAGPFAALAPRVTFAAKLPAPAGPGRVLAGFLSAGDELGADALAEIALAAARHPAADILYADESRISPVTGAREAFFKPGWSPDLMLATNYPGRPCFIDAGLLRRAGVTLRTLAAEGEYGVLLRCTEQAADIRRLPRLLCRRAAAALDTPAQEQAALTAAVARRAVPATVTEGCAPGIWRLDRRPTESPLVSIIIPTCAAHGHIRTCIETLRARTAWRQYEIIVIDNIPPTLPDWKAWVGDNADLVVAIPDAFNWSRFNNRAVQAAQGDYLLFLNDDIEVIADDWLDAMMAHAVRPEVGIVGPQLLYPDGKVQHAGMFLSSQGLGRHAFRMLEGSDPGYFGLARTARNVIAVTGACMLVRRADFAALEGFDEAHEIINNDLDYCLRAHELGQRIVFTPEARLIHHELASRDRMEDVFDTGRFGLRWQHVFAAGDPYFNPRLSLHWDDYRPDDEPAQEIFVGHPAFERAEIGRILALKLDHIGDFLTGLPAIRRLKSLFPAAELHVLASPAARSLAAMESAIDGFIEFQFFHTRSELGPRDLTEEDFAALEARLAPYGFDLAVDLRMHPDTRGVMRHVPARIRAGYDHAGQFPFLDIALEWDRDSPLVRKRAHVSDRLLHLVEAIATASEPVRIAGGLRLEDPAPVIAALPVAARLLFRRPVAAVHPGVGNSARQWPVAHYAALCDLLALKAGLNVVLIGGPDERALAEEVLSLVRQRGAVVSLAGETKLSDLPRLLAACALYVGNNSGPKHLAASLGVPTVGIHSGVVDAAEWGPLGERAVAVQRAMLCRPCYLLKAEDCPRDLACLRQLSPAMVFETCAGMLGVGRSG